jgi:hypothetical protein
MVGSMAKPIEAFKGAPRSRGICGGVAGKLARLSMLLGLALMSSAGTAPAQDVRRIAIFPFVLADTSLQGQMKGIRSDEQERLAGLDTQLRDLLAASGRCEAIDIAPVALEARASDLRSCSACATDMAGRLDAQLVAIPWVQKVSNLILNINVTILDAATGHIVAGGTVDIRGNTDESWRRGLAWLTRERLLAAPWPVSP